MLRSAAYQKSRLWSLRNLHLVSSSSRTVSSPLLQSYSTTVVLWEETKAATATVDPAVKIKNRNAALDFNSRRAAYNRQVSGLRKEYASEVAQQRAAEKAEQEALERELTRRRLERQRRKNARSAESAMREKRIREKRANEFNEHLRLEQLHRDAKHERFAMARQLVIEELEEEAPLWLTTSEEVEAAFTPKDEQLLWARPGGIFGAPNPSMDASLWQFETHTWHMDRTYKSQREILLENLEEMAYEEANVDNSFWTPERLEEQRRLEEKARLRAMVHSAGRSELIKKQRQMLEEQLVVEEGEIPKQMSAPSHKMLNDDVALEREGSRLLMEDPTKFFVFDKSAAAEVESRREMKESEAYAGPTLGSPVALRDPLREGSHQNRVFPYAIGKIPKPDMRTEKEKKREEREERMWAAAQAEKTADSMDIELAAEQQTAEDREPPLNYDEHEWDMDEEEWNKGLDPVADLSIINTPRENRYKEEDIAWVVETLESNVRHLEHQFTQDVEGLKQSAKAELRASDTSDGNVIDADSLEDALLGLSEKELFALADLDDRYTEDMSPEEFSAAVENIHGLTDEQVKAILSRDRTED